MRSMSFPLSLPLAAGLAIALSSHALADPAVSQTPTRAGKPADPSILKEPAMPPSRAASSDRGVVVAPMLTMRDELENFPVGVSLGGAGVLAEPTAFTGPDGFEWGQNNLRGQASTDFVKLVDLSNAPVGGANGVINGSRAVEIFTSVAQSPGGFFTGASLRWTEEITSAFDYNARASAEIYVSTIDQAYSFETASTAANSIAGRLYWGGECVETFPGDCADIGLPIGPLSTIYALVGCPSCELTGNFVPARYCANEFGAPIEGCTPPPGANVGDAVTPPIAEWARYSFELTPDLRVRFSLDRLDGAGEFVIHEGLPWFAQQFNQVRMNTSFESPEARAYFDNIEVSRFADPPPQAECPYTDNLDWLIPGPLAAKDQPVWTVFPPATPQVVRNSAPPFESIFYSSQIRDDNTRADGVYAPHFATRLPLVEPGAGEEAAVSFLVRTEGPGTTRAAVLLDEHGNVVTRLFFGRRNPTTGIFDRRVFVQTDPDFDPATDPIEPGVNVDAFGPTFFPHPSNMRRVTMRINKRGSLIVLVDEGSGPTPRYFGRTLNGASSFDTLRFESSNDAMGLGDEFAVDIVEVQCAEQYFCPGDVTFDGTTDFTDLNLVLSAFGDTGPDLQADANADDTIDFTDLNAVLSAFGTTCH